MLFRSASGVTVARSAASDAVRGATVRIEAANATATPTGAWCCVSQNYKAPYFVLPETHRSFGVWVKGDGSGALLNVQLECPREHSAAKSEHYARIDFTGWRYLEFCLRERDWNYDDYRWPYDNGKVLSYQLSRVAAKYVSSLNLYLNEIPAGGKTCVEVGAVKMLPARKSVRLAPGATVSVNGSPVVIPFALAAGDFAELEGGWWTRYGRMGTPIERMRGTTPSVRRGANALEFAEKSGAEAGVRARVTLFALMEKIPALKPGMTARADAKLGYEAVEPAWFAPKAGFEALPDLVARPGESATVAFEVHGPVSPFRLCVGGETREFPFALGPKEYVTCRDGKCWQLRRRGATAGVVRTGEIVPFAPLAGSKKVAFACEDPDGAFARIDFIKLYR